MVRLGDAWHRGEQAIPVAIAAAAGALTIALSRDVIIGIAVAAGTYAAGSRVVKARHGVTR